MHEHERGALGMGATATLLVLHSSPVLVPCDPVIRVDGATELGVFAECIFLK